MSTFHLISSDVKPLTRELAQQYNEMAPSPTERQLKPAHVNYLREKAEANQLVTFHWATAKLGNQVFRMNGQHSSAMLTELNGEFPVGLKVHIDHYGVEDEHGLALLFGQFDPQKGCRNAVDLAGSYQGIYPPLHGLPPAVVKLGADGAVWYRTHILGIPAKDPTTKYEILGEPVIQRFARWASDDVFSMKTPELKNIFVVASMFGTFMANEKEAMAFWAQVARSGFDTEEDTVHSVIDTWLQSIRAGDVQVKPVEGWQGLINAWNCHRKGKAIKEIRTAFKAVLQPLE
jgi:hypothetical protein